MRRNIQIFEPSMFIPFASFIYFSHAENSFMNKAMNRIGDVYEFTTRRLGVSTVVLYPGDKWELESREVLAIRSADMNWILSVRYLCRPIRARQSK